MSNLIAKRYVKALIEGKEISELESISQNLNSVKAAYCDDKFNSIIASPEVCVDKKSELVISMIESASNSVVNFIKLLGEKRRFDILPDVADELSDEIAKLNNVYTGVVYTNQTLSDDYVKSIEEKFSAKFNVSLSLSQNVCDYDGIKVDIDGLGVEISFSKERLKSQLIDHILKAV